MEPTVVGYANSLRRTMITDVETIAFRADITETGSTSDVLIRKNSTPLSNEMLAHRIGLIPIHVERPLDWTPEEYSFSLKVTNESSDPRDIVAGDIQVLKNRGAEEEPLLVAARSLFEAANQRRLKKEGWGAGWWWWWWMVGFSGKRCEQVRGKRQHTFAKKRK